jgi:plasmid stabilization system protein ParE
MRYTVIWTRSAEQRLANIWLSATDRRAVTSASARIDGALARMPGSVGTPLFDTVRRLGVPPLAVEYEVVHADRIVFVLNVWEAP